MKEADENTPREGQQEELLVWPQYGGLVDQASLWVPQRLLKWQADVLGRMMKPGSRVACVTPNGSGKTRMVIPAAGLGIMAAFPGAQVVSTAGVERQIKQQLWPVLRSALSPYQGWSVADDELTIKAPSIRGLPPSTWKAFTTKDPEHAEGFHPRVYKDKNGKFCYAPLMVIIDEAKSFGDQKFFDAFKRCSPDFWLVISTPGDESGPFFECFNKRKGKPWDNVWVEWEDCPHLRVGRAYEERMQEIEERGKDDPFVLSWIFGKFFRAGTMMVFNKMSLVDLAMSGQIRHRGGDRWAALDFSGGGDEAVFGARDGNAMIDMQGFREKDTTILGDNFLKLLSRWEVRPDHTIGDNGGLGKPIIDYMERKGFKGIVRYMADDAAKDQSMFCNRAAEDAFKVRQMIEEQLIPIFPDQKLRDEMRVRRYLMKNDDSNRIRLEPKDKARDRGEGSPNRLDTVTMLYADMPLMNYVAERRRIVDRNATPDVWKCFEATKTRTGRFGRR